MTYLGRASIVQRILRKHSSSPSLRHISDQRSIDLVSMEIVEALDSQNGVWRKWNGVRGGFMDAALEWWLPEEDLLAFLNIHRSLLESVILDLLKTRLMQPRVS